MTTNKKTDKKPNIYGLDNKDLNTFTILKSYRDKLIRKLDNQSKTVRNITLSDIFIWDSRIKSFISDRQTSGLKLTSEIDEFETYDEMQKTERVKNQPKLEEKNTTNHNTEMEQLKNESRVKTKKVKELSAIKRQQKMQLEYLKKFKTGHLTNKEIQNIVDSNRKNNGKINYTAVGRIINVSKDTVRKLIKDRRLTWLIDKPDSYTPK